VTLLFAEEMEKHWPGAQTNDSPWLTASEMARRLAHAPFDERRVGEEMRARLRPPPFNAQRNFRERDERWSAALAALAAPPANFISNYQAAVVLAPADRLLHASFAKLLEAAGKSADEAMQWAEVSRLLPHSPEGWPSLGRLARLYGDAARAKKFLQEALKQEPDAVDEFHETLRLRPNDERAQRMLEQATRSAAGAGAGR
jgi:tetratricopeptide (TPR) repeat protein